MSKAEIDDIVNDTIESIRNMPDYRTFVDFKGMIAPSTTSTGTKTLFDGWAKAYADEKAKSPAPGGGLPLWITTKPSEPQPVIWERTDWAMRPKAGTKPLPRFLEFDGKDCWHVYGDGRKKRAGYGYSYYESRARKGKWNVVTSTNPEVDVPFITKVAKRIILDEIELTDEQKFVLGLVRTVILEAKMDGKSLSPEEVADRASELAKSLKNKVF